MPAATDRAIRILRSDADDAAVAALLGRSSARHAEVERTVAAIVARVRRGGDRALLSFAKKFDGLDGAIEISRAEMRAAAREVPAPVKRAIRLAAANIRTVARQAGSRGRGRSVRSPGCASRNASRRSIAWAVTCPAAAIPLPSSLLMTAIPAVTAGVREVFAVCPRPDPTVMFAALEAGVTRLFRIGGAHAVAALAYGTASIPRVDKIVGPGNAYVAAAKALVAADCAIDFFAGPSEIAVVSSNGVAGLDCRRSDRAGRARSRRPRHPVHSVDAPCAWLSLRRSSRQLPAAGPAATALEATTAASSCRARLAESIALCQRLAPEHVVCDTDAVAAQLTRAGTVFVGALSAQACGDYVTGSNHVLPTSGAAAARGGLSAADFVRVSSVQHIGRRALARIGPAAVALAEAEGLSGHAAVRPRPAGGRSGV